LLSHRFEDAFWIPLDPRELRSAALASSNPLGQSLARMYA
jgi:hypothetical protein